jgi:two-component system cell cycle response regulator DivK
MGKKILIVEDNELNMKLFHDLLEVHGYETLQTKDGREALALARQHRPDLILMDIQLPVFDGYEATRRIKANPETKHIPIIAVTSYALSGDESKAIAAGCNGYVAKPFSPRKILAMVQEFLP